MRRWASETIVASAAYAAASLLTFWAIMPLQNLFFPEFPSRASLLFLPHGVRVLTAWLLGWRAVIALLPGVFVVFLFFAGVDVLAISRLLAILIAVVTAPAVFQLLKWIGCDLFPAQDRTPCWSCIMGVGVVTSILVSLLTNMAFGSTTPEYFAFLIGDMSGLMVLMFGLYFAFRFFDRPT